MLRDNNNNNNNNNDQTWGAATRSRCGGWR